VVYGGLRAHGFRMHGPAVTASQVSRCV